jgi:hypothetical protein
VSNVLVLEADHIEQPVVSDGYWGAANYAFEVNLVGNGRVYLFRDGRYLQGEWRRTDDNAPLQFFDVAGNLLTFKPGRTFVNLVPRWQNGYQLTFMLNQPLPITASQPSVILRSGPGEGYSQVGSRKQSETLNAIGRNQAGSWIQLLLENGQTAWVAAALVSVDADAVQGLPATRPTFEN